MAKPEETDAAAKGVAARLKAVEVRLARLEAMAGIHPKSKAK